MSGNEKIGEFVEALRSTRSSGMLREHDDYYMRLHKILSWMTELVWTGGPAADERRARVFPRMQQDPTGFPDSIGHGPFGPSDERARRLILGEE